FSSFNIKIKSFFMYMADAIITNSKELAKEVYVDYKQRSSKVYNLPFTSSVNSISEEKIDLIKKPGNIYIGCPGRLNSDKNQKILLDALPFLKKSKIVVVLAGSDEENVIKGHKNYKDY